MIAQGPYFSLKAKALLTVIGGMDDAGRALGAAGGLEGLGDPVEADDLADAGQGIEAARADGVEGAVPVLGVGPPPNWMLTPLWVARVQSSESPVYQPPAA